MSIKYISSQNAKNNTVEIRFSVGWWIFRKTHLAYGVKYSSINAIRGDVKSPTYVLGYSEENYIKDQYELDIQMKEYRESLLRELDEVIGELEEGREDDWSRFAPNFPKGRVSHH